MAWLSNKCRVNIEVVSLGVYITWDLLAATITASVFSLIGPAVGCAGVCTQAESVHQSCVLGRCGNLCSIVVLHH